MSCHLLTNGIERPSIFVHLEPDHVSLCAGSKGMSVTVSLDPDEAYQVYKLLARYVAERKLTGELDSAQTGTVEDNP